MVVQFVPQIEDCNRESMVAPERTTIPRDNQERLVRRSSRGGLQGIRRSDRQEGANPCRVL